MIIEALRHLLGEDSLKPCGNDLVGKEIDGKNFSLIGGKFSKNVVCIDGGCAILSDGGSWMVSKIKTAVVEHDGLKKIRQEVHEYYLLVIQKEKYEIAYLDNGKLIKLDLKGADSYKIEELPAKAMKYFEWVECLAQGKDKLIIMDSPLVAETDFEKDIVKKAFLDKNNVVGFCKTSRMRTMNGRSVLGLINKASPKNAEWFYYPIFENEGEIKTFVVKLDASSRFCYKVELPDYLDYINAFRVLSFFGKDSEMIGYPYPLYIADKLARVSSFEKKRDFLRIEQELKGSDLELDALSKSFHSLMDERMYKY
jgi:hypothetical protein